MRGLRAGDIARLLRKMGSGPTTVEWQAHNEVVQAAARQGITVQDLVDQLAGDPGGTERGE